MSVKFQMKLKNGFTVAVIRDESRRYKLVDGSAGAAIEESGESLLVPVWRDGKFLRKQSFAEVREVLAKA